MSLFADLLSPLPLDPKVTAEKNVARMREMHQVFTDGLEKIGAGERFKLLPCELNGLPLTVDWTVSPKDVVRHWERRQRAGVKEEVMAATMFIQDWPHAFVSPDSPMFFVQRATEVKRIVAGGVVTHTVTDLEGAGKKVPHPMGGIEPEDRRKALLLEEDALKKGYRGAVLNFAYVLNQAFGRELVEEIGDLSKNINGVFVFDPYFDTLTKTIVYPLAYQVNGPISIIDEIKRDRVFPKDIEKMKLATKKMWLEIISKARHDPKIEFDIVTGQERGNDLLTFSEWAMAVQTNPDAFYPGTLEIMKIMNDNPRGIQNFDFEP